LIPGRKQRAEIKKAPSIRMFLPPNVREGPIPDEWDWRDVDGVDYTCNQGFDQKYKGSCTSAGSTGMAGALELIAETFPKGGLCKLFIYNNARNRGGLLNPPQEGAYMIHVMQAMKEDGICREALHPYDVNDPEFDSWPLPNHDLLMIDAANFKITDFGIVDPEGEEEDWIDLACRAIYGLGPLDMGSPWTRDWSYNLSGHLDVPADNAEVDGGHSYQLLAYRKNRDSSGKLISVTLFGRNSWDAEWPLGTTTGDFDFPAETFLCPAWKNAGGYELYRAVTDLTHVCPEGEHWDPSLQMCMPDPSGPEPTTCEEEYNKEMPKCFKLSDVFALLFCAVEKIITYWICAFGELAFKKAIRKKKTMQRTLRAKSGSKYRVTVTITEPKK